MKKVLIYGGSGGVGSSTARLLKEKQFDLHLVGHNEEETSKIASELNSTYTVGDVRDKTLFSKVAQEAGESLSGLVYAVGTLNLARFQRFHESDFIEDLHINAVGAALAIQSALPALTHNHNPSSIVLFSSVAARQGFSSHASVSMAKGAVSGLTLSLAAELAPRIRVNAIAPSLTRTPLSETILSNDKLTEAIAKQHPLQRLGQPEDIAKLAVFLISSDSDWITGQIISVDGGRSTIQTK
jgi:NAD(P)-dependent dehydrogenase (short-subunit alcohol dehydrogenase family)